MIINHTDLSNVVPKPVISSKGTQESFTNSTSRMDYSESISWLFIFIFIFIFISCCMFHPIGWCIIQWSHYEMIVNSCCTVGKRIPSGGNFTFVHLSLSLSNKEQNRGFKESTIAFCGKEGSLSSAVLLSLLPPLPNSYTQSIRKQHSKVFASQKGSCRLVTWPCTCLIERVAGSVIFREASHLIIPNWMIA